MIHFEQICTPRVRAALERAKELAQRQGGYVGTDHLLLALLSDEHSAGPCLLRKLGIDTVAISARLIAEFESQTESRPEAPK